MIPLWAWGLDEGSCQTLPPPPRPPFPPLPSPFSSLVCVFRPDHGAVRSPLPGGLGGLDSESSVRNK